MSKRERVRKEKRLTGVMSKEKPIEISKDVSLFREEVPFSLAFTGPFL